MLVCESEPELLLRRLFALYSQLPVDDPKVLDAAAQTHAVYARGYGSVTLDFGENRLNNVRPTPIIRFPYVRGT